MAAIAAGFLVASTVMKMKGQADSSRATQGRMVQRKAELEANAQTVKAVAQQKGFEEDRKTKIIASRAQAFAAFSGAGATDSTVSEVISDITGEGEYRRNVALYNGQEDARRLLLDARSTQEAADAERKASKTRQLTNLFDLGSSAYSMFGKSGGGSASQLSANDRLNI